MGAKQFVSLFIFLLRCLTVKAVEAGAQQRTAKQNKRTQLHRTRHAGNLAQDSDQLSHKDNCSE
jgi:hypothetical protein